MEAAGHNPCCVLPQNSFRTDGIVSNLGVFHKLVYFLDLWLRTANSEELVTTLWTNAKMYDQQANIMIPYNEKSGTFTSYTLEGGKHKSKNALWKIKVKYMRDVDETLSVAAPTPLAAGNTILPHDSFRTDLSVGLAQTLVVFPDFWVQTSGPDKTVISWSGKKQTVRLYNERTGTFKAHTMAYGRALSENAKWQIKIQFSKFVSTGNAAPRPTQAPPGGPPPAPPDSRNTGPTSPDESGDIHSDPQELELEPDTGSDYESEQETT